VVISHRTDANLSRFVIARTFLAEAEERVRILILGARGMLGVDLTALGARSGHDVMGYDLPEVDIAGNPAGLDALRGADWVVNCAAYTDVDRAESEEAAAAAVNGRGAGNVAAWCARRGTPLVHLSTDYVFDGTSARPYREDDPVRPLNAYGRGKLAGEEAVRAAGARGLIVRTQSLYGLRGRSFARAIRERLERDTAPVKVVTDQVSSPTYTVHLAEAILRLMKTGREGIVHVSATGGCSWYDFACAIAERAGARGRIVPVTSAEFPRPARRPAYSVLDTARYASWTGHKMPTWAEGLNAYFEELEAGQR
jgi:dTDP-4-dehydrorhamnose reductase